MNQQPKYIEINETLRLRTPEKKDWDLAYPWYQNPKVMYLSEGVTNQTYELYHIYNMYEFLST
ncbi:MAG: GNAT family N-acetyltransferase, partial [Turicibacter sp.]|nr:GNAT family N-acetyltransferase [Turicibacter sp.]